MKHDNRHWVLISPVDLSNIDFSEVCETSTDTSLTNLAGDKAFIKWDGPTMPASVAAVTHLSAVMTHEEITSELSDGWHEEIEFDG